MFLHATAQIVMFAVIDLKKTTLTLQDGTGTPNTVAIKIGEGNLSWTEKKAREYIRDKGQIDSVRDGDEDPMEVRFDFMWEFLLGDGTTTIEDALKKRGGASSWVSSDTVDACQPYAVDIKIFNNVGCDPTKDETVILPDFRYETLDHDLRAGQISCQGMCNALEPTTTRNSP